MRKQMDKTVGLETVSALLKAIELSALALISLYRISEATTGVHFYPSLLSTRTYTFYLEPSPDTHLPTTRVVLNPTPGLTPKTIYGDVEQEIFFLFNENQQRLTT